jgi:hypothetical protein
MTAQCLPTGVYRVEGPVIGPAPSLEEVIAVLARIHTGEITLFEPEDARRRWEDTYAGYVDFKLSNGWTLIVFNDCGGWDYVERIVGPWGDIEPMEMDPKDLPLSDAPWWQGVVNWTPPDSWGV